MTNAERYKSANERATAFLGWQQEHCTKTNCQVNCPFSPICCRPPLSGQIPNSIYTAYCWLDLEAEAEEPLPCPFCGAKCEVHSSECYGYKYVRCTDCEYYAPFYDTESEAIAAHNRVAIAAKESEISNGESHN